MLISPHITPVAEVDVAPIHIATNDGAVRCCRDGWLDLATILLLVFIGGLADE